MISSRLILGVNANPSPSSSPLQQGERRPVPLPGEGAWPTTHFDRVLVASHQLSPRRPLTLILFPSAKGRGDPDSWQARRLPYNMF